MVFPFNASARFSGIRGNVGIGYLEYEKKLNGTKLSEESSLSQRYSLSTGISGNIFNKRTGAYNFSARYNHIKSSSEINGKSFSPSIGSFLWSGSLSFKMPRLNGFKFRSFTEKGGRTSTINGGLAGIPIAFEKTKDKRYGLTTSVGINGGLHYQFDHLTEERETPSSLFLNSKTGITRFSIVSGITGLHLSRQVSSVGSGANRTVTKRIQAGNIAIRGYNRTSFNWIRPLRTWMRLLNWLETSTLVEYSSTTSDQNKSNLHYLNLLAKADRGKWNAFSDLNYQRSEDNFKNTYTASLPLSLSADISPFFNVHVGHRYSNSETTNLNTLEIDKEYHLSEIIRSTFAHSKWLSSEQTYRFDKNHDEGMDQYKHSLLLSLGTTRKKRVDYNVQYQFNKNEVDGGVNKVTVSDSHSISGGIGIAASKMVSLSLSQGYLVSFSKNRIPTESFKQWNTELNINFNLGAPGDLDIRARRAKLVNDDGTEAKSDGFSTDLDVGFNLKPHPRLSIGLNLNYGQKIIDTIESKTLSSRNTAAYKMKNNFLSTTIIHFAENETAGISSDTTINFSEQLQYTYYKRGFTRKRLFDIDVIGTLSREKRDSTNSESEHDYFRASINYYPTRNFNCGYAINIEDANNTTSKGMNAYFSLSYPLARLSGKYDHNEASNGSTEDKYMLNLSKSF